MEGRPWPRESRDRGMARQSVGEEGARRRRGGQAMGADETTMRVLVLTGARPDIIKSASVAHAREAEGRRTFLVHGGPHDRAFPALCRFLEMRPFATVRPGSRGPRLAEWRARQLEAPDPVIARATRCHGGPRRHHDRARGRAPRLPPSRDPSRTSRRRIAARHLRHGAGAPHGLARAPPPVVVRRQRRRSLAHAGGGAPWDVRPCRGVHGIASALRLDGERDKAKGVPLILVGFFVSAFASTAGFLAAMGDMPRPRRVRWRKTPRDRDRAPGAPDPATRP